MTGGRGDVWIYFHIEPSVISLGSYLFLTWYVYSHFFRGKIM